MKMDLLQKAKITEEEASILMKANEIIIRANSRCRLRNEKAIQLRLMFENTVVRAHIAPTISEERT